MTVPKWKTVGNEFPHLALCSLTIILSFSLSINGYLDVNQYCKAFDVNFKPIICIIKNGTSSSPHPPPNYNPGHHPPPPPPPPASPSPTQYPIFYPPPPGQHPPPDDPDYTDYDDDDDCSCEVTCIPRIIHQRSFVKNIKLRTNHRNKRTSTSYRCKSCGTECPVKTSRPATCYCAIPASKAECSCNATCATFRSANPFYFQSNDDEDDAQCILSVTALEDWRIGEERPPYLCECQRSKEAENTSKPDFVCICQRVTRD